MDAKMMKALAKGKKPMSEDEKNAKLSVLKDLRNQASSEIAEKVKSLKAPKSEASKRDPFEHESAEEMEDSAEELRMSPERAAKAEDDKSYEMDEDCSPEEIDAKIEKLMALKQKMSKASE